MPEGGEPVELELVHQDGLCEALLPDAKLPLAYALRVRYPDGHEHVARDPYAFLPTLGPLDLHLIAEGRHLELWTKLGAHVVEHDGVTGTAFAVWAPNARAVSVVGDFNGWDGRAHPLRTLGASGVWELFLPDVLEGLALQVRAPRRRRRAPHARRPDGAAGRAPACDRLDRHALAPRMERRRVARARAPTRSRSPRRCRSTRCTSAPGA